MTWTVHSRPEFERQFARLDPQIQTRIAKYIHQRLEGSDDPRPLGKALTGSPRGRYRFRIGDYRLLCTLDYENKIINVYLIGHRRDIYDRN